MFLSKCFSEIRGSRPARFATVSLLALTALVSAVESGGNAIANGESRTISIYHTHTGESLTVEYKRNGSFDRDALEKLNWLLRDWRRDEPTSMDPRLFDIVWEAQRSVGSTEPINVVSAYRSPQTNAMLRRQSKAVAKNSQHMLGKAMDFYLTDANITDLREIGMRMQRGGVGYYPNAYTPFVHLDAGSVRHWPRMSHDELARLFPDGKTVHIPSDGRPLERYAEAEQEILANGGTVLGTSFADAGDGSTSSKPKSLWAFLFGGGNAEEDESEIVAQKPVSRVALAKPSVAADDETPDTPEAAITRKPTQTKPAAVAVLPPLSSFKFAKAAPKAPMPLARPGSQPLLALSNGGSQLVWQTGAQPLSKGKGAPSPASVAGRGPALIGPVADVPLPPLREKAGRVAALSNDDGPATTASIGAPKTKGALQPLITEPQNAPTIALAYAPMSDTSAPPKAAPRAKNTARPEVARLPEQKPNQTANTKVKTLSKEAIAAAQMPASSSTTRFSMADDPAPVQGRFSTKDTAVCSAKAVAAGQACIPNASR